MTAKDLKRELVAYTENTNDEKLLFLIRQDFVFYLNVKDTDITDGLGYEQLKELTDLGEEHEEKETQTLDEFKKATQRWRTK